MKHLSRADATGSQHYSLYNGLDALLTVDLLERLDPLLDSQGRKIYQLEKDLRAPILLMMQRGLQVDQEKLLPVLNRLRQRLDHIEAILKDIGETCGFYKFNPRSDKQVKELFYEALAVPHYHTRRAGGWTLSTDRKALESFSENYVRARMPAQCLLRLRDLDKDYQTLSKDLTEDGRWLASFNPAGTDTGRWSSSKHPLWLGSNLQNVGRDLRHLFIPPPGRVFIECDLKGAESRAVAYLSGCTSYIDAVESSNIHSHVAKMIWKIPAEQVKTPYYRDFTYYDMAKRGGHLSNYYGTPPTMAMHLKIPQELADEFQKVYFREFPGIRRWHHHIATELQRTAILTTPFGRRRTFWDRTSDDTTLRKAIAYVPQSLVCDILSVGALRIYHELEPRVWLHAQVHDALLMSVAKDDVEAVLPLIKNCLSNPLEVADIKGHIRNMLIPPDAAVGLNWGKYDASKNPNGIKGA